MTLSTWEQKEIKSYFKLDKKIQAIKRDIQLRRERFYDQSMATRTTYGDISLISVGFDAERNVIPYLDSLSNREEWLKCQVRRKRYFDRYLDSLNASDRSYLVNKYKHGIPSKICQVDIDAYDEIKQINEAINHMIGFPAEVTKEEIEEHSENIDDQVNFMAEVLGV